MPIKPQKMCNHPGCKTRIDQGAFCDKHGIKEWDKTRATPSMRGYDRRWRKARTIFLSENPLCVKCLQQERLTPATEVDHVIPHKGDYERMWDKNNWQSLCKPCHSAKTRAETLQSGAKSTKNTHKQGGRGAN